MTIYGISGLGADERVFQYLELPQKIEPIRWIKPGRGESIQCYARRLADQIKDEEFILVAVSFGGLIAVELNKILKPTLTILISSAATQHELRTSYRLVGKTGLITLLPPPLLQLPKTVMYWLFGANNKKLLREIMDDTDVAFAKWALVQLTTWTNTVPTPNLIKIHGTRDKLIPYHPGHQTIAVENGEHFMIVDQAKRVSQILEEALSSVS